MKPSGKDWNENYLDALFFEYLEGNLSEESVAELEKRLAANDTLQSELELWKETVVEQEFYNTELLEKSLLQEISKPINPSYSTFVFVVVMVVSLFRFLPLNEKKDATVPFVPMVATETVSAAKPLEKQGIAPVSLPEPTSTKKNISATLPDQPEQELLAYGNTLPDNRVIEKIAPNVLDVAAIASSDEISAPKVKVEKQGVAKTYAKRSSTRKERRKIERMKEKARQKRMANKFLKGNTPYVVPLNSTNF